MKKLSRYNLDDLVGSKRMLTAIKIKLKNSDDKFF
jgi:hypothetical protein